MNKLNVLGGYVSLGGDALPAGNSLTKTTVRFPSMEAAVEALCEKVFGCPATIEEPKYDPRLDNMDIPPEVYEAAALVMDYFTQHFGHDNWQFMGLQPKKWK